VKSKTPARPALAGRGRLESHVVLVPGEAGDDQEPPRRRRGRRRRGPHCGHQPDHSEEYALLTEKYSRLTVWALTQGGYRSDLSVRSPATY
jgi:hypothetical protein